MGYYNDPRKNIHSIYTKEKMINSYAFAKSLTTDSLVVHYDFSDVRYPRKQGDETIFNLANPLLNGLSGSIISSSENGGVAQFIAENLSSMAIQTKPSGSYSFEFVMKVTDIVSNVVYMGAIGSIQFAAYTNGSIQYSYYSNAMCYSGKQITSDYVHFLCTYDIVSQIIKIYINGVLQSVNNSIPSPVLTENLVLGRFGSSGYFSSFNLAQFRMYSKTLSDSEISANYNYVKHLL